MRGHPNNNHWDCGGECIHGGLVGPGRECNDCWAGMVIRACDSDTRPKDGDAEETAPLASSAAIAQNLAPNSTEEREKKGG